MNYGWEAEGSQLERSSLSEASITEAVVLVYWPGQGLFTHPNETSTQLCTAVFHPPDVHSQAYSPLQAQPLGKNFPSVTPLKYNCLGY